VTRISLLEKLCLQAEIEAKRSTCSRLNVGALIWDERGVILSSGYNGALAGMPHCEHVCDCDPVTVCRSYCQSRKPCEITMHAEANAILWAARRGVSTEGQNIITTHLPCYRCAQLIIQAGIRTVYFINTYRDTEGFDLLKSASVKIEHV
jgi:dCMP deaminase